MQVSLFYSKSEGDVQFNAMSKLDTLENYMSKSGSCKVVDGDTNQLTVSEYKSMDSESKCRLHNKVRQWALWARISLPNEHSLFCLVVSHLLKNAH